MGQSIDIIKHELSHTIKVLQEIQSSNDLVQNIELAANKCLAALTSKKRLYLAGNGGSAADSQHIAGEFVSRFLFDRPGLPAIALTTDTSVLTAIGNDYGFEKLFSRQLQALASEGDVFIAYSTSGSSPNILRGIEQAREMNLTVIGMTGNRKGEMNSGCDVVIEIPSADTPKIQEGHIVVGHIICQIVEKEIFG